MADAARNLGKPDAAGAVAKVVTGMMGNGKSTGTHPHDAAGNGQ